MFTISSEGTFPPLVTSGIETHTSKKNDVINNITNILNLPIELQHKIAWSLDAKDYISLRETSSLLSHNLPSFSTLSHKLKTKSCCGEFKIKNEKILNNHKLSEVRAEKSILKIIASIESKYISPQENILLFDMEIPRKKGNKEWWNPLKIMLSIHNHTKYCFFKSLYQSLDNHAPFTLSLAIDMPLGENQQQMEQIFPAEQFFHTLQSIFNQIDNAQKYIIAAFAAELMQCWKIKPPRGSNEATVRAINTQHHNLVCIGEMVKKVAIEENPDPSGSLPVI